MATHARTITLVLAAALLALPMSRELAAQGPPPQTEPALSVPMELLANRPIVRFKVNGQGPFAFLLSPQEPQSQIDPELAETLKLKTPKAGDAAPLTVDLGYGMAGETLKLPIAIGDLSRVVSDFSPALRPRGVISLAHWKDHLVTLDYVMWRLTVEPGALPEANERDVFALGASGAITLPMAIAGHSMPCRVDPLFPSGLVLPLSSVEPPQMDGAPRDGGVVRTPDGLVRVQETRLATNVTVGPFELKTPMVLLAEQGDSAMVGTPWLGRFALTYDVSNARVRLTPANASSSRR